jgi:uncharacterized phage protein (TIGR01671 family)
MFKKPKIQFRFYCRPAKGFIQDYKYNGLVEELFDDELLIPSQYTGFFDDYGNKIFEGDIISYKRKDRDGYYKAAIEFVEGGFLAKILKHEGTLSFWWIAHIHDYEDIKVIGNIWDDLDLL